MGQTTIKKFDPWSHYIAVLQLPLMVHCHCVVQLVLNEMLYSKQLFRKVGGVCMEHEVSTHLFITLE